LVLVLLVVTCLPRKPSPLVGNDRRDAFLDFGIAQ
jgi:hypothetical protein